MNVEKICFDEVKFSHEIVNIWIKTCFSSDEFSKPTITYNRKFYARLGQGISYYTANLV
jgi:hypothetical protein